MTTHYVHGYRSRENQRLQGELAKARKVMRVQGELSALLEELASESADAASEPTR